MKKDRFEQLKHELLQVPSLVKSLRALTSGNSKSQLSMPRKQESMATRYGGPTVPATIRRKSRRSELKDYFKQKGHILVNDMSANERMTYRNQQKRIRKKLRASKGQIL